MASLHLGWVDAFLESSNCAGRQEISARWALNFHIEDPGRGLTVLKHSWYANNLRELQRLKPVLARYFYVPVNGRPTTLPVDQSALPTLLSVQLCVGSRESCREVESGESRNAVRV